MALSITNNVSSLVAQDNLSRTSSQLATSLQRLSSGLKINSGADGPAALVISEQQAAQVAGLKTAIDNTSKAIDLVKTAEGALSTINNLLTKIRSLALDSANSGVNDANALAANQAEVTNALDTINRIAQNTQFGTKKLLDGSAGIGSTDSSNTKLVSSTSASPTGTFAVVVSTAAQRANTIAGTAQTANLATNEVLTINGFAINLSAGQNQASVITTINEYSGQTGVKAHVGTAGATELYTTDFGSAATIAVQSDTAAATDSSGFGVAATAATGVDIAGTIGGFAATGTGNVLTGDNGAGADGISISAALTSGSSTTTVTGAQGNVNVADNSLVFQIGANANQTVSVAVANSVTTALGLGVTGSQFSSLSQIDVTTQAGAQDTIKVIDQAINDISNLRGSLGAVQANTLQSSADNLRTTLENTTSALATIRDTDFAAETANFTKSQVLLQVGATVLSNANATSQLVLSLTKNL